MTSRILSRNKWMLYAHNQHIVVRKGTRERFVHPVMKALIWALYLPDYPTATIEVRIGDKYKPDVVAFAETPNIYQVNQQPLFWGEAGQTGRDKIQSIVRRFPNTHFAMAKWDTPLTPYVDLVSDALKSVRAMPRLTSSTSTKAAKMSLTMTAISALHSMMWSGFGWHSFDQIICYL